MAASGPLATLPLSALVTAQPAVALPGNAAGYAQAAWLARRQAVSTLPAVASLRALRSGSAISGAAQPFVGFGNPLLSGPDGANRTAWSRPNCASLVPQVAALGGAASPDASAALFRGKSANIDALRSQSPLPETANELCAVALQLDAGERDVNLGERATEGAVKSLSGSGALSGYRVVHFATHGLLAGETAAFGMGAEPSLLLTPPAAPSDVDDGLLTASEVAQLKLDADWVVLSACNTAGGEGGGGEALSGLARAFFYAGARALLVSHWYVDSDASVKLITHAFAELKSDPALGRAEAMRRAMLAVMADASRPAGWLSAAHPAVWAPFVVVGEGGGTHRQGVRE